MENGEKYGSWVKKLTRREKISYFFHLRKFFVSCGGQFPSREKYWAKGEKISYFSPSALAQIFPLFGGLLPNREKY